MDIKFPFGSAKVEILSATGDQDLTITDNLTVLDGVANAASGNRTINLTISDDLPAAAMIFVQNKTAGTETLVFGNGITGATITGVAGKTFGNLFVYNGSAFIQASTPIQVD